MMHVYLWPTVSMVGDDICHVCDFILTDRIKQQVSLVSSGVLILDSSTFEIISREDASSEILLSQQSLNWQPQLDADQLIYKWLPGIRECLKRYRMFDERLVRMDESKKLALLGARNYDCSVVMHWGDEVLFKSTQSCERVLWTKWLRPKFRKVGPNLYNVVGPMNEGFNSMTSLNDIHLPRR